MCRDRGVWERSNQRLWRVLSETAQLSEDEASALIIVQSLRPDRFFNATQQQRLVELVGRWRMARDKGKSLPTAQQVELEALVEAELRAATDRAAALADELRRCRERGD